jgi:hypothetical protein
LRTLPARLEIRLVPLAVDIRNPSCHLLNP